MRDGKPMHPSIPRIQCPRCGTIMRLARVEPATISDQDRITTFDCECGFIYQQDDRARAAG